MNNPLISKAEKHKIIIEVGKNDKEILELAKQLRRNLKYYHPNLRYSLDAILLLLGEIGIYLCEHDDIDIYGG